MIQTSQRVWQFHYSRTTGILYSRRKDWNNNNDNKKYQFDAHERNDEECFVFAPSDRKVELKYIPTASVPVDVAPARN